MLDDLRTAARALGHRPRFTVVVVLTLAVALGANAAVFSVLEQVLLRPLPFPGADRLVYLLRNNEAQGFRVTPTLAQVQAWGEGESFEAIAPLDRTTVTLLGRGEPRALAAGRVSHGLFDLLGVRPRLGRGFSADPADAEPDRVVLGHRLWRELFAADPRAVGATLRLDDRLYTVAGVVGPELQTLPPVGEVDLWIPFPPEADATRTTAYGLARLAPGVSAEAAGAELAALERHRSGDSAAAQWRPEVIPPAELFGQFLGRQLLVLQIGVALMLLIGCANVGNLFLVRAAGRGQEIAVRVALGAGRGRLVRTVLLESLLVAIAGAALGLVLAVWTGRLVIGSHQWPLLDLQGLRLDPGLFGFTAAAAGLATVAFGLVPAVTASRTDLAEALRTGTRTGGSGGAGGRTRAALAAGEIALSLVLLVGAGLLTRHFVSLLRTDPGFDPEGLVALSLELPEARYGSPESQAGFVRGLADALDSLDLEVALASGAPPHAGLTFGHLETEGASPPAGEGPTDTVAWVAATPGYFRTVGIPILAGRPFLDRDTSAPGTEGGEAPLVINRALAERLWPGESPLGRRLRLGTSGDHPWYRVVGVAGDAAQLGLRADLPFQAYAPLRDGPRLTLLARASDTSRAAVVDRLTAAVHALDPALPIRSSHTVAELLRDDLSGPRFEATLMLTFAAISLALAALGVYAVLAHAVRRRSFEMGVRAALGARPGQVLGLVARQAGALAALGLGLGLAAALGLSRFLGDLLGDVSPRDPLVLGLAVGVLAAACALATAVPAARAARLDPARVLREE